MKQAPPKAFYKAIEGANAVISYFQKMKNRLPPRYAMTSKDYQAYRKVALNADNYLVGEEVKPDTYKGVVIYEVKA